MEKGTTHLDTTHDRPKMTYFSFHIWLLSFAWSLDDGCRFWPFLMIMVFSRKISISFVAACVWVETFGEGDKWSYVSVSTIIIKSSSWLTTVGVSAVSVKKILPIVCAQASKTVWVIKAIKKCILLQLFFWCSSEITRRHCITNQRYAFWLNTWCRKNAHFALQWKSTMPQQVVFYCTAHHRRKSEKKKHGCCKYMRVKFLLQPSRTRHTWQTKLHPHPFCLQFPLQDMHYWATNIGR